MGNPDARAGRKLRRSRIPCLVGLTGTVVRRACGFADRLCREALLGMRRVPRTLKKAGGIAPASLHLRMVGRRSFAL